MLRGYPCVWGMNNENWNIILVYLTLLNMKCPTMSLLAYVSLKSVLLDILCFVRYTPVCFLSSFPWKIFLNALLWGNIYLWYWGVLPLFCRRRGTVFTSILLVRVFLLDNWICFFWSGVRLLISSISREVVNLLRLGFCFLYLL